MKWNEYQGAARSASAQGDVFERLNASHEWGSLKDGATNREGATTSRTRIVYL